MNTQGPPSPSADEQAADDAWLDAALAQSFTASDPVPHFHGDVSPAENPDDPLRHA